MQEFLSVSSIGCFTDRGKRDVRMLVSPPVSEGWLERADAVFESRHSQLTIQANQDLADPKAIHATTAYFAILTESETVLTVMYFLLHPACLKDRRHAKFPCILLFLTKPGGAAATTSNGIEIGVRGRLLHGRSYDSVAFEANGPVPELYLSWPQCNPQARRGWIVRPPCVEDEDTRGCNMALQLEWRHVPASSRWWQFHGLWGFARSPYHFLKDILGQKKPSGVHYISNDAMIALAVVAAVWAVVVIVVVSILFVRLKNRHKGDGSSYDTATSRRKHVA